MKFIVRSCNSRLWYVKQFLIPELIKLGVAENDILHINDDDCKGCLNNWIVACNLQIDKFGNEEGVWHLQDDVLPSDNFYDIAKSCPTNVVCNGFVTEDFNPKEIYDIGYVPVQKYWFSFQCIYMPTNYIREFLDWFYQKTQVEKKYSKYVLLKKYDDLFFWLFMKERHKDKMCLNIVPNMVQHVDDIIGGSVANSNLPKRKAKAFYWYDADKEERLKQMIGEIKNE